jgi:hypothetical protein
MLNYDGQNAILLGFMQIYTDLMNLFPDIPDTRPDYQRFCFGGIIHQLISIIIQSAELDNIWYVTHKEEMYAELVAIIEAGKIRGFSLPLEVEDVFREIIRNNSYLRYILQETKDGIISAFTTPINAIFNPISTFSNIWYAISHPIDTITATAKAIYKRPWHAAGSAATNFAVGYLVNSNAVKPTRNPQLPSPAQEIMAKSSSLNTTPVSPVVLAKTALDQKNSKQSSPTQTIDQKDSQQNVNTNASKFDEKTLFKSINNVFIAKDNKIWGNESKLLSTLCKVKRLGTIESTTVSFSPPTLSVVSSNGSSSSSSSSSSASSLTSSSAAFFLGSSSSSLSSSSSSTSSSTAGLLAKSMTSSSILSSPSSSQQSSPITQPAQGEQDKKIALK